MEWKAATKHRHFVGRTNNRLLTPHHRCVINGKRAERDRKRDAMANGMSLPKVTPNGNEISQNVAPPTQH